MSDIGMTWCRECWMLVTPVRDEKTDVRICPECGTPVQPG